LTLRNGAVEAYNVVMFRMRWHEWIDEWCLIQYHGKWHNITSCDGSKERNEMQITAVQMPNQKVTLVENDQK